MIVLSNYCYPFTFTSTSFSPYEKLPPGFELSVNRDKDMVVWKKSTYACWTL